MAYPQQIPPEDLRHLTDTNNWYVTATAADQALQQSYVHYSTIWTNSSTIYNVGVDAPTVSFSRPSEEWTQTATTANYAMEAEEEASVMTSIEQLITELYSHEVSSAGKYFVTQNLRMYKSVRNGCSAVEANSTLHDRGVPLGTRLLIMKFNGILIVDRRIRGYVTSRAYRILSSVINSKFLAVRSKDTDLTRTFRLNLENDQEGPQVKVREGFTKFLKNMYADQPQF